MDFPAWTTWTCHRKNISSSVLLLAGRETSRLDKGGSTGNFLRRHPHCPAPREYSAPSLRRERCLLNRTTPEDSLPHERHTMSHIQKREPVYTTDPTEVEANLALGLFAEDVPVWVEREWERERELVEERQAELAAREDAIEQTLIAESRAQADTDEDYALQLQQAERRNEAALF